eukprot:1153264-Prymnesium_polylepis.1
MSGSSRGGTRASQGPLSPGLTDSMNPWIVFERKRLQQAAAERAGSPKAASKAAAPTAEPQEQAAPRSSAQAEVSSVAVIPKPTSAKPTAKPTAKPASKRKADATAEQAPAKASKTAQPAAGESRDEVLEEFRNLLLKAGKTEGKASDGAASRYPRFMKLLFDSKHFTCRSDFFADGAEERATAVYEKLAAEKFKQSGSDIPVRKYLTNFMHGFSDFVNLAKA